MITREEFWQQAFGKYASTNPTADFQQIKLYADGAVWAWDYLARKQREDSYRKAYTEKPARLQQLTVAGADQ